MSRKHQPTPRGILQDAGELAVASDRTGSTRHRYAMVVSFTTEAELRQALKSRRCVYRDSQAIQEARHG
ncbi:MAG: hypothetical protein JJU25_07710 [Halomonas sp.]|nr:hypothetical protein [Halomonas sp.]MCC5882506.1 hypothetical protein [Halomonas sp.]